MLLFNAHLSDKQAAARSSSPTAKQACPTTSPSCCSACRACCRPSCRRRPRQEGFVVTPASRGFVFNADLVSVIRFLDIGTRVAPRPPR